MAVLHTLHKVALGGVVLLASDRVFEGARIEAMLAVTLSCNMGFSWSQSHMQSSFYILQLALKPCSVSRYAFFL